MKSRTTAYSIVLMVLLAACGARLTSDQRAAGIGALGGGSGGGTTAGTTGATTGLTTGTGTTGTGATTGTGGATGGTGTGGTTGAAGSTCTGTGAGGATDTGVTANQLTIATASDKSGLQAGLFKSTMSAMQAWAAMVDSQGGICGRIVKNLLIDTKTDSTENNAAVRQSCDQAFALVGSMSAFDQGGAQVGESCGIPDLTAITVNGAREKASNVYPIYPVRPDKLPIGTANYIKRTYGDAVISKAAMLWLNADVTRQNAKQRVKAYEGVGFKYVYQHEVQVVEPNYGAYVNAMKSAGVQYVDMVANLESIQKLLQAMDQGDFHPTVRDWDSVAYSQKFVVQNGTTFTPANGSLVFLNTNIVEESTSNPEMQLYVQWLARVAPGEKPDYFGFYGWSAGRLFEMLAKQIGPHLTRKAVLDAVKKVHSWDGHGLHAAQDVGNKIMSPCFLYLIIQNGKFVRKDPASGFSCDKGGIVNTA